MEIFVVWRTQGAQAKIVNGDQIQTSQSLEALSKALGGTGSLETVEQFGLGGEQHAMAGTYGAVSQGLRDVTLTGASMTADEHWGVLGDEAAGGQLGDQAGVKPGTL